MVLALHYLPPAPAAPRADLLDAAANDIAGASRGGDGHASGSGSALAAGGIRKHVLRFDKVHSVARVKELVAQLLPCFQGREIRLMKIAEVG